MDLTHVNENMNQMQSLFTRLFSNVENLPDEYRDLLAPDLEQLETRINFLRESLHNCHEEAVAPVLREKKKSDQELRNSEERFRSLFDGINEGFALHEIICDANGQPIDYKFLDINPSFERLTGLGREDVIGKTIGQIEQLRNDDPKWVEIYGKVALTGEAVHFENYSMALQQYYEVYAYCPAPGQFAVLFMNITDRKLAEQRVEAALADVVNEKNRLLAVMEALPIPVAILDAEGGMLMANPGYDQIWSGPRPVPQTISDYVAYKAWWGDTGLPVQPEEWASAQAVMKGETVIGQFMQIQQFDGNRAYILNNGAPVRDAQGQVVGSAVALVDITERIQAENTLRESERNLKESNERFRVALSTLPMTVYKQDEELRYTWIYDPRQGWNTPEIMGKRDDELYPGGAAVEFIAVKQSVIDRGEGVQREIKVLLNGEWKYFLLSLDPLIDPSGKVTGLIGASLDVTEQRQFENEHREAVTQMEVQRRLLEYREKERQLIARDLHDGPVQDLSSLLFNIQFAREAITDPGLNVELEQIGHGLKGTVQNLREMINELRPPSLIRFGLAKALQVYLENFREKHTEIELDVVLMDEGGCLSEQARLNLYRIVQEALTNAINHANATRIAVLFACYEHDVVLEIQDNGNGFTVPENLVDFPLKGHFGLVGMKERSEAIGGTFRLSSQMLQGTTIEVIVPVADRK